MSSLAFIPLYLNFRAVMCGDVRFSGTPEH